MSDNRLVPIRTSASANELWSHLPPDRITESGHILPKHSILPSNHDTPYGRQIKPFIPPKRLPLQPCNGSRIVERNIFRNELKLEEDKMRVDLAKENAQLKKQNKKLMTIIHLLTEQMADDARNTA